MVESLMFNFFVNDLFGNLWFAIIMIGAFFAFIGVIGKMGTFLLMALLALYLSTMLIIFGGALVYAVLLILALVYFSNQLYKYMGER